MFVAFLVFAKAPGMWMRLLAVSSDIRLVYRALDIRSSVAPTIWSESWHTGLSSTVTIAPFYGLADSKHVLFNVSCKTTFSWLFVMNRSCCGRMTMTKCEEAPCLRLATDLITISAHYWCKCNIWVKLTANRSHMQTFGSMRPIQRIFFTHERS